MAGEGPPPEPPPGSEPLTEQERRRLAEIFGDVLPSTTSDERADPAEAADRDADERFLADRPPHHDRER
jgi:hypothetical protein